MASKARECFVCHAATKKMKACGWCERTMYCGVECQKADWKRHRKVCCTLWPLSRFFDDETEEHATGIEFPQDPKFAKAHIYELVATNPFSGIPTLERIFDADPVVPMNAVDYETLPAMLRFQADKVPVGLTKAGLVLVRYQSGTRRGGKDGFELVRQFLLANPARAVILGKSARRRLYGSTVSFPKVPGRR